MPSGDEGARPNAVLPHGSDGSLGRPHYSVLIVEDEPMLAAAFEGFVRIQGHSAESVHHPDEVLAAVKRLRPDVILLDIGLPGRSGYEVAAELAGLQERASMRIIALSGHVQDLATSERESPFDDRLVKPVRMNDLIRAIERA